MLDLIRNFVIIAHIDHGKSTLADRMLEVTGTIEKRLMRPQYLDQLELERERGITIKMAPVRMHYGKYILNLIDTPGHADFRYEVSRALAAVEGAVLLVDATQGMQAQTLANYESAKKSHLTIVGAVNKIDVATAEQIEETVKELAELLGLPEGEIMKVSGKTGVGVSELLEAVVERVPSPSAKNSQISNHLITNCSRALIFDSLYSDHKGIIAFIRVVNGAFSPEATGSLIATKTDFKIKELGYFMPQLKPAFDLKEGEIGYVATGIKDSDKIRIGDTLLIAESRDASLAFPGYTEPKSVVFVTFYPEDADQYEELKKALSKLRLTDASLTFEPDSSDVLGRGFKGGFLGRLHFEITAERLLKEFNVATTHSFPSVAYRVKKEHEIEWQIITNPKDFTMDYKEVEEPVTRIEILTPIRWLSSVLELKNLYRLSDITTEHIGGKIKIVAKLPLADLIRDFDDKIKSVSQGFASLNYEFVGFEPADVEKLDVIIAEQLVPGLTRILPRKDLEREARITVERLKELLPPTQFAQAIQAATGGRILARETIPALRKDVTGYLYGGDRTRKMKLWKKQQKGKKRLKEMAGTRSVTLPASIFKELLKK